MKSETESLNLLKLAYAPLFYKNSTAAQSAHNDKWVFDLQAQISAFLIASTEWLGLKLPQDAQGQTTARLMDYACGNGIVSRVNAYPPS